jgi:hypothetical protein
MEKWMLVPERRVELERPYGDEQQRCCCVNLKISHNFVTRLESWYIFQKNCQSDEHLKIGAFQDRTARGLGFDRI